MNAYASPQTTSKNNSVTPSSSLVQSEGESLPLSFGFGGPGLLSNQINRRSQNQTQLQLKQALNQSPQVVAQAKLGVALSERPRFTNPPIQRFQDPETKLEVNIEELPLEKASHYLLLNGRGTLPLTSDERFRLMTRELTLLKEKHRSLPVEPPDPVLAGKVNSLSDEEISRLSKSEVTEFLLLQNKGVRIEPSLYLKLVKRELDVMTSPAIDPDAYWLSQMVVLESGDVTTSASSREDAAEIARKSAIKTVLLATETLRATISQSEVQEHFAKVFQSPAAVDTVLANLARIAAYLEGNRLRIDYRPDDRSSINAYTLGGTITLQTRFFTTLDQTAQRNTVIHEAVHATLGVPDYAYTTERLITALNPEIATRNPDNYVWFLAGLLEGKKEPKNQVQDVFTGEFAKPEKFELSKTIGLATSSFLRVQELFRQAVEDAEQAFREPGRKFAQNTIYAIQQVKKVFTGTSREWNQDLPTEAIARGLSGISKMLTYLYGSLTAPVTITWADTVVPKWTREGTGPVSLAIPRSIRPESLYELLTRTCVRDLLEPTRGDKWKQYYNLIVNVSPNFINLGNYVGTRMSPLTPEM
ncbi:MAG: hypothetical protein HY774_11950 [Acidobacteria bacterium]|nr:hypothetical protein [Acidobacteriota bacterium]